MVHIEHQVQYVVIRIMWANQMCMVLVFCMHIRVSLTYVYVCTLYTWWECINIFIRLRLDGLNSLTQFVIVSHSASMREEKWAYAG